MRRTLLIILTFILIFMGLGFFGLIALPRINDPFPPALRAQLTVLNDERRELEWLVGKARMAGRGNELPQERQEYDALASDANAWLKTVAQGLETGEIDTASLGAQFDRNLQPRANAVLRMLKPKMSWMGAQRRDLGLFRVAAAEVDHFSAGLEHRWHDMSTYFKFARAGAGESKQIGLSELDDMKWVPWSSIMAEQF